MALLGAPFSRRSRRCGSCESTAIRMVAGTPAQRYIACDEYAVMGITNERNEYMNECSTNL